MNKTLLEELKEASVSNYPAYVEFYNNGLIRHEERGADKRMTSIEKSIAMDRIKYVFTSGAENYAKKCSFDSISLNLEIGLLFNEKDVVDDKPVLNAEPVNGIIHCYTGSLTSYLNGEKSNETEYYHYNTQGFVNYETLVSEMKENGLSFVGPETFDELKEKIMDGNIFDIRLDANLKEEKTLEENNVATGENVQEELVQEPKEEVILEQKEEPKKLVRVPFFGKRKNTNYM